MLRFFISVICAGILLYGCQPNPDFPYIIEKSATSNKGMVVSAHPLATQVGVDILEAGGNAVDAGIAVQLALAVVYPRAGNIGGGGFMVYRGVDGEIASLDYRERAPAASDRDMYLDSLGNVIPGLSIVGHLAAGVPGTVAGLAESHRKYGKLDWSQLVLPAVNLASNGFKITENEAIRLNRYRESIGKYNDKTCPFVKDTTSQWLQGQTVRQPDLAKTLQTIADLGEDGFYSGPVAESIIREIQGGGGIMTLRDLAEYKAVWRDPITTKYKGYRLISMPPPSSGGIALAQLLEIVEDYPIDGWGFQSPQSVHLMAEAERRVYADRARHLGDMDFYDVPLDTLLDANYLDRRMATYIPGSATLSTEIEAGDFKMAIESFETTHLSVVDADGNAVSITTTLNSNYGCKVMVDGAGFFLNNEMDDFSVKPGIPNQFGLIGAEANAIEPGKRMLSSMTPTIVEKSDRLFMTIGTPGGSTIITSVFQVFINVAEFGMTVHEAVQAPRFHHQWLPDEIKVEEEAISDDHRITLESMGHTFRAVKSIGMVEAIMQLPDGTWEGAADRRGDDHAAAPK